jgi:hypothetical protein
MKKLIPALVLVILVAGTALAESSVWIVKTDSTAIYVGGTIHFLRQSDMPLPPEYDKAYEASDVVVLEADLSQMNSPEVQQAFMAEAAYTDGRTLDSVLSEEAYTKLEEYCTANGIPMSQMNQMKPWMVMMALLSVAQQKLGANQPGVDLIYLQRARDDGKAVKWLESIEAQIDLLTSMGEGYESAFILYNVNEMKMIEEKFDKLMATWRAGDKDALHELLVADAKKNFPELFKTVFVDRNMDWLPKLEDHLATPETEFVLVGTGHLIGEEGVLAHLEELGYEVDKVQ